MAQATGAGPEVISAADLIGDTVVNTRGEDVGRIEEIMIDLDSGAVGYFVLSFGGFFGAADKFFAIPWKILRFDAENRRFTIGLAKEKLQQAPGFDKNSWPRMGDLEWGKEVHKFYDRTPYWMEWEEAREDGEEREYRQ